MDENKEIVSDNGEMIKNILFLTNSLLLYKTIAFSSSH